MMSCADVVKCLYEFMDKEIDEPRYFIVQKHLSHCDECRQRYEFEKGMRSLVKSYCVNTKTPAYLHGRILRGLDSVDREQAHEDANPAEKVIQIQKVKRFPVFSSRSYAVAASLLLSIAMSIFYYTNFYHNNPRSIVNNAVKNHVVAVNNNLVFNEKTSVVNSANDYLEKTINGKLRNSSPLLNTNQIRVVGGIPAGSDNGDTNNSCVIFDEGGNKLSLQTIRNNNFPIETLQKIRLGSREFYLGNCQGFNSVLWKEDDLVYCLTSDIHINEMLRFAEALTSR